MKKIFAFAMAIVSMAAVMTSCNNDNTDFIEQKAPVAPLQEQQPQQPEEEVVKAFDGNIFFCAYPEQMTVMNLVYEVKVGDNTTTINLENLQTTDQEPIELTKYFVKHERLGKQYKNPFVHPNIYIYHVPAQQKGDIYVTPKFTVKEGAEIDGRFDTAYGIATMYGSQVNCGDLMLEDIDKFFNIANGKNYMTVGHK